MQPQESTPLVLAYAPAARPARFHAGVFLAGLGTITIALLGVYLFHALTGMNVMGIYLLYVLPVGAIIVGLVAGSGFSLGSYWSGFKIRAWFFLAMLLIFVGSFFFAQYLEFLARGPLVDKTGHHVSFWYYFHLNTMSISWSSSGRPLEEAGYLVRLVEIVGFSLGGWFAGGLLMQTPYCDLCGRYERQYLLVTLPGGVTAEQLMKADQAIANDHEHIVQAAETTAHELQTFAAAGDLNAFMQLMLQHEAGSKAAAKLPRRVVIYFHRCPTCRAGTLRAAVHTGTGRPIVRLLYKVELPSEFISTIETAAGQIQ